MRNVFEDALYKIKNICTNQLNTLFLQGIPDEIQARYEKESQYLEQSEYFDEFEKVLKESQNNKGVIYSKGTISGSFLYFLMTKKGYNPLKPYYYCETCGYYESIEKYQNCMDAPDKCCPKCGSKIEAAGYNVSIESVWGLDGKKAIGFEKENAIHPVVEKRLKQLVAEFKPRTFEDKIKLCTWATNIYLDLETEDKELDLAKFKLFISSEEFKNCEFHTREELYEKLCERGIYHENAFKMSEFVRKGGTVRRPSEIQKYEIPEDVVLAAQNICYLESRPHAIQTAYRYWIKKK